MISTQHMELVFSLPQLILMQHKTNKSSISIVALIKGRSSLWKIRKSIVTTALRAAAPLRVVYLRSQLV